MSRSISRAFLLLVLLTGWGLALARLGERSLWADEGFTAVLARDAPSVGVLEILKLDPNQGILHLLLVIGVMHLGGSEFILRFPSAMAATLALPLLYLLGRRLMSRQAGLAGAFLHSISPYIVAYAQEARPYALLELLSCLSLVLLLRALDRDRWFWWAALSATLGLLVYTHHFGWLIVGAEFLFCLLVLLRSSWVAGRPDPRAKGLLACFLAALASYLPWLTVLAAFWRQSGPGGSPAQAAGLPLFSLSLRFFRDMLVVFGSRASGWQVYLLAAALLLGLATLALRSKWSSLLLAGLWFAVPLSALTALAAAHFFDYRYVIFFLPVLLLLAAEGLAAAGRLACRLLRRPGEGRVAELLAAGLAVLLFLPANFPGLRAHHRWEKENWRGISTFIAENLQADEAVYVSPRYWAHPMLYYRPQLKQRLVGGSAEDVSQLISAAQGQPGLWFVRYSGRLGDPTGNLGAWLDEHGYVLLVSARSCGRGIHVYYGRTGDGAEARQADLLEKAARFCPGDGRIGSAR